MHQIQKIESVQADPVCQAVCHGLSGFTDMFVRFFLTKPFCRAYAISHTLHQLNVSMMPEDAAFHASKKGANTAYLQ